MLLDQANFHIRLKSKPAEISEEEMEQVYEQVGGLLDALVKTIEMRVPSLQADWDWARGPSELGEEVVHFASRDYGLCGRRVGAFTSDKSKVTCEACKAELEW